MEIDLEESKEESKKIGVGELGKKTRKQGKDILDRSQGN